MDETHDVDIHHRQNKRTHKRILWSIISIATASIAVVGLFTLNIAPFRAFGGAIWLKDGVHYISNAQITSRVNDINAPKEAILANNIKTSTPYCENAGGGFCQKSTGAYVFKTLVTAAVPYKPGTPDKKEIIGYCTLCADGTFSPSCAVGRGACSWHRGVASYNVPRYRITPGTPPVQAVPAVYSYEPKTYKDSLMYTKPDIPNLKTIVGF